MTRWHTGDQPTTIAAQGLRRDVLVIARSLTPESGLESE